MVIHPSGPLIPSLLRTAVILLLGLGIYVRFFESRLLFYPSKTLDGTPRVPFEVVHFTADDSTKLHGWFIPFQGSSQIFVISHGNAGNIGDRYEMGEFIQRQFQSNVFMYDYRGYGESEGEPSEPGLYSDLRGALQYISSRGFVGKDTYLIGQSLGSAVAVDAAARERVAGIILEAPFPNVGAVAQKVAVLPIGFLFSARFDSLAKINKVTAPIAIIHGTEDPVIPFDLGLRLFDAIRGSKKLFPVQGTFHEGVSLQLGSNDLKELREFLAVSGPH